MAEGFVYVFANRSFPGYVKIGKTAQTPEDRAKELSAASGVPTPFEVVYCAPFRDCDRAGAHIHALLEARGVGRAPNREFFSMSLRDAVAIVVEAEAALRQPSTMTSADCDSAELADADGVSADPIWRQVADQAVAYHYGLGDTIQDADRAMALYRQAAQLGATDEEVYASLAALCADRGNEGEGLRWLARGAECGVVGCWAELALLYMGENSHFDAPSHAENAAKAWRRFFRGVDLEAFDPADPGGNRLYAMLVRYVSIARDHPNPTDAEVIRGFGCRLAEFLEVLPMESERNAKLAELQSLLQGLPN
jgi:hypothetical protein